MNLFDLHCDTLTALYDRHETLHKNTCHISLSRASCYRDWRQVFAVWSRHDLSDDENYARFFRVIETTAPMLRQAVSSVALVPYLGVEGGALLGGHSRRLDHLFAAGVRILTLTWAGNCCIGGAHDTTDGLTAFGYAVLARCLTLGILPDLSHASDTMFWQTLSYVVQNRGALLASHSNCRALCNHRRNLSDSMLRALFSADSLCGLNLCPSFLSEEKASAQTASSHVLHMLDLGGEGHICLGCDLDGTALPEDFQGIEDLYRIADCLAAHGLTDLQIDALFFGNAASFFDRHGIAAFCGT